jgi:hypothetical protein
METRRLVPFAGIAFVALVLLAVLGIGGETPASGAAAAEVASFYDEHTIRQFITAFVLAASAPFLVLFGVGLARLQPPRQSDGGSLWSHVVIGGSILAAGTILVSALVHLALVDGAEQEISPTALQALNALDGNTWIAFFGGLGVMMLGAAGTLLSAGSRRWLGWTAFVLGVALFVPFADFFAMMLTAIWIIVASVLLARRNTEAVDAMAPSAA